MHFVTAQSITLPFALLAGFFSFISPCVLPLVPAYIGYLTAQAASATGASLAAVGAGADGDGATVQAPPSRWVIFMHGVAFVIGFAIIFVLLGISVGAIGQIRLAIIRSSDIIGWIGGIVLVIFGLHTMGVIRIPLLYYDTRSQAAPRNELGLLGSAFMGITFSAGWTPCVGPMLGAILTLGGTSGSIGRAALLLITYSLGLGIPFLAAAVLLDRMTGPMRKLQKHMRTIEIVSGILLIGIGLLVFTGMAQRFSMSLSSLTNFSMAIDEWLVRLAGGGQ